jgi:hypothetical protein
VSRSVPLRRFLQRVLEFAPLGVDLRTVVRIGRKATEGIVGLATEDDSDRIIFGWGGRDSAASGGRREAEAVSATIARPPRRAVIVRSTRSHAIRVYATRKMPAVTQTSISRRSRRRPHGRGRRMGVARR